MIVINGQKYNAMNNIVQLDGLLPGNYPVKVCDQLIGRPRSGIQEDN